MSLLSRCFLLTCMAAACGQSAPQMSIVLETPPAGTAADPFGDIDQLSFSVARQGDSEALLVSTFAPGESITLTELPFGEKLVAHLSGRLGADQVAYGRSCVFVVDPAVDAPARRLFFSRIVKMAQYRRLQNPSPVNGIRLPDGAAMFVGGGDTMNKVERFDPESGVLQTLAEVIPRKRSVLVSFEDGRALLVGGVDLAGDAVPTVELLQPDELPVRRVLARPGPQLVDHAAVALIDPSDPGTRTMLVVGGSTPTTVTGSARLFRVIAGGEIENTLLASTMISARAGHTLTRLRDDIGDDVLIIGGLDENGLGVAEAEVYRPQSESFEALTGARLITPRFGHTAIRMPDSSVLIVGGFTPGTNQPVTEMELYDVVQKQFAPAGQLPANAGVSELSVTPLPDGRVLLAGGRDVFGQPVMTVHIARLDPIDRQVDLSVTDSLSVPRAGHTAVRLCDGTILIAGGTAVPSPTERYNPVPEGRR